MAVLPWYTLRHMSECLCLCNAIQNAASLLDRQLNAALNGLDISHCQAAVLVELVPQSATVSHLSKVLCCSCGNISQLVDALEGKELVERVQSEHDRRRAEVKLTAKGRKLGEQARDALSTRASDCCNVFTPEEKSLLRSLLEKYVSAGSSAE